MLCGDGRAQGHGLEDGFFVESTIFEDIFSTKTIAHEEIFGPVLALIKVESLEEAIRIAKT